MPKNREMMGLEMLGLEAWLRGTGVLHRSLLLVGRGCWFSFSSPVPFG
jgi:hypothetical protein